MMRCAVTNMLTVSASNDLGPCGLSERLIEMIRAAIDGGVPAASQGGAHRESRDTYAIKTRLGHYEGSIRRVRVGKFYCLYCGCNIVVRYMENYGYKSRENPR